MIPVTGHGVLGIFIPLGVGMVAVLLGFLFPSLHLLSREMNEVFFGSITGISALLVWLVGRRLNKDAIGMYVDPETRRVIQYDREHTLCGIPLQGVSVVILILGAMFIYQLRQPPQPRRWVSKAELKQLEEQQREMMRDYAVVLAQYRAGMRVKGMTTECVRVLPQLPAEEQPGCRMMAMVTSFETGGKVTALYLAQELQEATAEMADPPLLPVGAMPPETKEEARLLPVLKVLRALVVLPNASEDKRRAAEVLLRRYEMPRKPEIKAEPRQSQMQLQDDDPQDKKRVVMRDYAVLLGQFRLGIRSKALLKDCTRLLQVLPEEVKLECLVLAVIVSYETGNAKQALSLARQLQESTQSTSLPPLPLAAVPPGSGRMERVLPMHMVLQELAVLPTATAEERRLMQILAYGYEKPE